VDDGVDPVERVAARRAVADVALEDLGAS